MPSNTFPRFNEQELAEFYAKKGLRVKRMEECDFEAVEKLNSAIHFDVGYHNLKLYSETSPDTWFVVYDKNNQAVHSAGLNLLSNGVLYAFLVVMKEDWLGEGLAGPLIPDFQNGTVMASSTPDTIKRDSMHGRHWLEKRHGLYRSKVPISALMGPATVPIIPQVKIETLKSELMEKLLVYDGDMCLVERRRFTEKWCLPEDSRLGGTVLAMDEYTGHCVGYASLRLLSTVYSVQPVYADNERIAVALVTTLLKWYAQDAINLYMPVMADKPAILGLCHQLGMTITSTEMRHCTTKALQYALSLPMHKVYTVQEYYPA